MSERKMVLVEVVHDGGQLERIATDDPRLLGEWLIYTTHQMPQRERGLQGNWRVTGWTLEDK